MSGTQAFPDIMKVDLNGTVLVQEQFVNVIANGGSGMVMSWQSGHRLLRSA